MSGAIASLLNMTTRTRIALAAAMLTLAVGLSACAAAPTGETTQAPAEETNPATTGETTPAAGEPSQSAQPEVQPTPVDLTGEWKQTNSAPDDAWQAAALKGDTIEINWVSGGGDTTSLYWAGSIEIPADAGNAFTWTSNNDHSKTDGAILASNDDTKDFTYDNGVISYKVSALGTTTTVKLERQ